MLTRLNIFLHVDPEKSPKTMTGFLHNMSMQALSKSNVNIFHEFDKIVDLITNSIGLLQQRNRLSIKINEENNNEAIESINNYRLYFKLDPMEEIQENVDDMIKKDITPEIPVDFIPPTPLTSEEIRKQTREEDENFIETSLAFREVEFKAADEISNEENKNVVKSIVDPTSGLVVDDEMNNNDINFPPNTTDNIYQLPPKVEKELNDIFVDGIIPQQKFDNEPTIDVDYEEEIKPTKIVVPPPKDYAQIEKLLGKTTVEIHNDKVEDIDVDINDYDDVDIINITPSHPRDRLRRKIEDNDNKERDDPYIRELIQLIQDTE